MGMRRIRALVVLFMLIVYSLSLLALLSDCSEEVREDVTAPVVQEPVQAEEDFEVPRAAETITPEPASISDSPAAAPSEPAEADATESSPVSPQSSTQSETEERQYSEPSDGSPAAAGEPLTLDDQILIIDGPEEILIDEQVPEEPSVEPEPDRMGISEQPMMPVETETVEEEFDDDFWSEFFVAGEEDVSLFEEGSFYVPLFVNSDYIGDIMVTFQEEEVLLNRSELEQLTGEDLVERVRQALFDSEEENIALSYLNALGIEGFYDYATFELYLEFSTWMLPVKTISINQGDVKRYGSYEMSGSEILTTSFFSTYTNLSIQSSLTWETGTPLTLSPSDVFNMQGRSSMALWDLSFDFSWAFQPGNGYSQVTGLWSTSLSDYVSWGGIQGFYDFVDTSVRLSFGNISEFLGLNRDSYGIGVEKRYTYGTAEPNSHQFRYSIQIDEPSIVEVFINEKSVYRRQVLAGLYTLQDFIFSQGVNDAIVTVTAVRDEEDVQTYDFSMTFDSRLMAAGDTLYAAAVSTPADALSPRFRISQTYGLLDEMTGGYTFSASTNALSTALNFILSTRIGTIQGQGAASLNSPLGFGYAFNTSMSVAALPESDLLSSLSFNLAFTSPSFTTSIEVPSTATPSVGDLFQASLSVSGTLLDTLRYGISSSVSWYTNDSDVTLRGSLTTGISLIPDLAISASLNYLQYTANAGTLSVQIGASYSISQNASISTSTDLQNSAYISGSVRPFADSDDTLRFSFNGLSFADLLNHTGSFNYSHSGQKAGLNVGAIYSETFSSYALSMNLNTAFAYAGGLFGMARNISDTFMLVRPGGAMADQEIAVTRTMTTDPERLPSLFGTSLYDGMSVHENNNIVVYGIGSDLLNSSESFIYTAQPRPRQGYAVRVSSELAYSVVGTLLRTPSQPYDRYTVDIVKVERDASGEEILMIDEGVYLFTDESGFFFMSGLTEGDYQFSMFLPDSMTDDLPVDVRFTVERQGEDEGPKVLVLDTYIGEDLAAKLEDEEIERKVGNIVEDPVLSEDGYFVLDVLEVLEESEFWEVYYPQREVVSAFEEDTRAQGDDYILEIVPRQKDVPISALSILMQENPLRVGNLMRLREVIRPLLESTSPEQFTLTGDILRPSF